MSQGSGKIWFFLRSKKYIKSSKGRKGGGELPGWVREAELEPPEVGSHLGQGDVISGLTLGVYPYGPQFVGATGDLVEESEQPAGVLVALVAFSRAKLVEKSGNQLLLRSLDLLKLPGPGLCPFALDDAEKGKRMKKVGCWAGEYAR